MSLHIIAEAATNHNGNFETAKKLVDSAKKCGADSVKFQVIYPEGLYLERILQDGVYTDNEVFQIRKANALRDDEYRELSRYCREQGIQFTASVFDRRGVALLDELDVDFIKLASCDLNNSPLVRTAAETGRKVILSTGMATLGEIEQAVIDFTSSGNSQLILMHCVSIYPCPLEQMNLGFIRVLKEAFGFPVGLSDHTADNLAGAIGVSMGVDWVEKHFTLDRGAKGFDHAHSMDPEMFSLYVGSLRQAAQACKRSPVKVGETESSVKKRARRSLYAARDIAEGEILTEEDILIVRPEGPFLPGDLPSLFGRCCKRKILKFEPFSSDMFS